MDGLVDIDEHVDSVSLYTNRVLAIDDDPTSLFLIEQQLIDLGYEPDCVNSGAEGLALLDSKPEHYGAIILDRMMPEMDGLSFAREMSVRGLADLTPVVMLSGADSQDEIREGIEVGVFYYLTKPAKAALLKSVVAAAIRQCTKNREAVSGQFGSQFSNLLDAAQFQFRNLDDARSLTGIIANVFPDPRRSMAGIGALLENAVEHGIAGIGYDAKGEFISNGLLSDEVARRLDEPDRKNLTATAKVARKDGGVYLVVTDPGSGFVWRDFVRPDQSRAATSHGRGIAQANARSFDKLSYNASGNQAVAFATNAVSIEW